MTIFAKAGYFWCSQCGHVVDPDVLHFCPEALRPEPAVKTVPKRRSTVWTERRYHRKFAKHRLHGEWFRPAPELVAFALNVDSHGRVR